MKKIALFFVIYLPAIHFLQGQPCTPLGDQVSYGTGDIWSGYVYDNTNFTTYSGYVNKGAAANPNFDENFGGDNVNYATNGCPVFTQTFSVRYKLTKTFTSNTYEFIVGGDDGYRLSLDGGATWVINNWSDHAYTTTAYATMLNGSCNMVLEYYENGGGNRISFSVAPTCIGTSDDNIYGTGNTWRGYAYDGMNFNIYKGVVTIGSLPDGFFDENFGGSNTNYNTNECPVYTETFSMRYRLQKTFVRGSYTFTIGGDDGYRLSLDGGATWVINRWVNQSYTVTNFTTLLNGTYNLVLEYYENGGDNRISYSLATTLLPMQLIQFDAGVINNTVNLLWKTAAASDIVDYTVEKSEDGQQFHAIGKRPATHTPSTTQTYRYTDEQAFTGTRYYRLKITDSNGGVTYSSIKKINLQTLPQHTLSSAFWQNNMLQLRANENIFNITLSLYDLSGRRIIQPFQQKTLSAGQTANIPITASTHLPKGMYVLVCSWGNGENYKQLIANN